MSRSIFCRVPSFLLACLFFGSFFAVTQVAAQDELPQAIKITPALLQQVAETRKVIDSLPAGEKLTAFFQLLSMQMQFEDKAPARETITAILAILPAIDNARRGSRW